MSDYWSMVFPTYIENWPKELCSLSIPQVDIPLSRRDMVAIGMCMMDYCEGFFEYKDILGEYDALHWTNILRGHLSESVSKFKDGAFIRLGSRSPKDSWSAYKKGMKITDKDDPLFLILDGSERMSDDLHLALHHNYESHIFVRKWVDIPKWAEFRCFMKSRRLVGISQYHYLDGEFPELADSDFRSAVRWAVDRFFGDFRNRCHLVDVVFDVFVDLAKTGSQRVWQVKLLEINPFFEDTDPCLYDWRNGGDWDHSIRVVGM